MRSCIRTDRAREEEGDLEASESSETARIGGGHAADRDDE